MSDEEALAEARRVLGVVDGPRVVRTVAELREVLGSARDGRTRSRGLDGYPRAVVMTMGALHEGHAMLMRAARDWTAMRYDIEPSDVRVVVTLFVNPTQFGPGEDFDRYPRAFDADVALCGREQVDLVFAPDVEQVYPDGAPVVTVDPGPLGAELEGEFRPGHFAGMLTIVAKLLDLTEPSAAFFGEKDYQQLTLIRRMVRDLDIPVDVVGVPTVRDDSGLALSSRNAYLSEEQRREALAIVVTLAAAQEAAEEGIAPATFVPMLREHLESQPGIDAVDYLEVRDPDLGPAPSSGEARILVAARVGGVRLLDNAFLELVTL